MTFAEFVGCRHIFLWIDARIVERSMGGSRETNGLYYNERSIVNSIYNRIAIDVAAVTTNELRKLCGLKDI